MGVLDTFFIRYRADTGQAVKDIEKLNTTEEKEQKTRDKGTKEQKAGAKELKETLKTTEDASKKFGESLTNMSKGGTDAIGGLRAAAGGLGEVIGKIGPAGMVAAVGIGAIVAAIAVANTAIADARESAKEAITLGEEAFEARLAQGELIRLQGTGRSRGLSDQDTTQSAKGVNSKGEEIRAAQRQAARDPASAFNNPLIKQAALWKKAGVDVAAGLEKQMAQQDAYLRKLNETGQAERALVEGTQLFGRTLADVKSVLSTTQQQMNENAVTMAKENNLRRTLQASGEKLATAEQQLENARKANDERIASKTVPATEAFTKAVTEWEKSIGPLKDTWANFVSFFIEGLTSMIEGATSILRKIGVIDDVRLQGEKGEEKVKNAGDEAEAAYRLKNHPRMGGTGVTEEGIANARKQAEDKARAEVETANKAENENRGATAGAQTKVAASELVKDGKFEGKTIDPAKLEAAMKATEEAVKNDPSADTLDDIKAILSDQLSKQEEQGKVQKAQTDYTKKIESNTLALVNTGLEQAMALWAAGVGKGGGVSSGSMQGETQTDYEKRVKTMQRTINPNAAMSMDMGRQPFKAQTGPIESGRQSNKEQVGAIAAARQSVNKVDTQADALNKSKLGATGGSSGNTDQSKNVTIQQLTVEVKSEAKDVGGLAQDVGVSIADELKYAAAEFASPVVS